jgi:hypothetical protein
MYEIDKFKSDVKKVSENNNDIIEKIKELLIILISYLKYLKNNNEIQPKLFNIIILTIKNINNIKEEIIEKLKKSIYDKDYNNIKYIFENEIFPTFNTLTRNGGKKTIKRKYSTISRVKSRLKSKSKLSKKKKGKKSKKSKKGKKSKRNIMHNRNKRGGGVFPPSYNPPIVGEENEDLLNNDIDFEDIDTDEILAEELNLEHNNNNRLGSKIIYFILFCVIIFTTIISEEFLIQNSQEYREHRNTIRNVNLTQDFEYIKSIFNERFFE